MQLPLDSRLKVGVQTIHRRTEPAVGPWRPSVSEGRDLVECVDRLGYDSLWLGDHLSFAIPILDPLIQLAQAACETVAAAVEQGDVRAALVVLKGVGVLAGTLPVIGAENPDELAHDATVAAQELAADRYMRGLVAAVRGPGGGE